MASAETSGTITEEHYREDGNLDSETMCISFFIMAQELAALARQRRAVSFSTQADEQAERKAA